MLTSLDHLASQLRALLVERELTQAELGRRTGISGSTLNRIVHGKRQPNARELGALAHVLEVDLLELLGVTEVVSTLTSERDELERRGLEAALAAEQAQRQVADELEAANEARAAAFERTAELEGQLDELGRAQVAAQAEVERLRRELETVRGELALLKVVKDRFSPKREDDRPEWLRFDLDSPELAPIRARHEIERARAQRHRAAAGKLIDLALLWWQSRRPE